MHCKSTAVIFGCFIAAESVGSASLAYAADDEWSAAQIADALTAAPSVVTNDARIFAWDRDGKMVMVRDGAGAYVCVASGMTSTRVGKPDAPYKDPACFDQNAWAFFQAVWAEKNPMKPSRLYPSAPGMAWMLAGMGVGAGMVKMGTNAEAQQIVAGDGAKVTRLTPHIMIIPLPIAENAGGMAGTFDPDNAEASWVMFPGSPLEHLMVHFSEKDADKMMRPDRE